LSQNGSRADQPMPAKALAAVSARRNKRLGWAGPSNAGSPCTANHRARQASLAPIYPDVGAGEGIRTLDPNLGKVGISRFQAALSLLMFPVFR
jgi:hypothetical protein